MCPRNIMHHMLTFVIRHKLGNCAIDWFPQKSSNECNGHNSCHRVIVESCLKRKAAVQWIVFVGVALTFDLGLPHFYRHEFLYLFDNCFSLTKLGVIALSFFLLCVWIAYSISAHCHHSQTTEWKEQKFVFFLSPKCHLVDMILLVVVNKIEFMIEFQRWKFSIYNIAFKFH